MQKTENITLGECIESNGPEDTVLAPMPLFHMSKAEYFQKIIKDKKLIPKYCEQFNKNILYFCYGGAFYRSGKRKADPTSLPVVFMFQGNVVNEASRIFPYDTGGVPIGYYDHWTDQLGNWERYSITNKITSYSITNKITSSCKTKEECMDTLLKFVEYVFGDNEKYKIGKCIKLYPDKSYNCPLVDITEFYNSKLSKDDPRRSTIECQFESNINLNEKLIWMAYPSEHEEYYQNFIFETKLNILKHSYDYHRCDTPDTIEAQIRKVAADFIDKHL